MGKKLFTVRKLMMASPLVALGLCFQNFTELEVPTKPDMAESKPIQATSGNGAAEELIRRELPELKRFEDRFNEKLQFRFESSNSQSPGEIQLQLTESSPATKSDLFKVSLINDRLRLDMQGLDLSCDYTPTKDLLSLRTSASTDTQFVLEHSSREGQSRLNWQKSW